MEQQTITLFERIGGINSVNLAVDIFYSKVEADDRINHFFRWIDMETQAHKLKGFLAFAFGATTAYTGMSMRHAHAHLVDGGLNPSHFEAVMGHLTDTLYELKVSPELIREVVRIAESAKSDVLGL